MTAPEKIYAPMNHGLLVGNCSYDQTHKTDIEYIRADIHEAEMEALKAENANLKGLLEDWLNCSETPPDSNCSCHINPPCNDCIEWAYLREMAKETKRLLEVK